MNTSRQFVGGQGFHCAAATEPTNCVPAVSSPIFLPISYVSGKAAVEAGVGAGVRNLIAVVLQARPFACDAGSGWTAAVESEAMIQTVVLRIQSSSLTVHLALRHCYSR